MTRDDVTADLLAAKRREGLSFNQIADHAGADRVWLTAALLGQHPLPPDLARRVGDTLGRIRPSRTDRSGRQMAALPVAAVKSTRATGETQRLAGREGPQVRLPGRWISAVRTSAPPAP